MCRAFAARCTLRAALLSATGRRNWSSTYHPLRNRLSKTVVGEKLIYIKANTAVQKEAEMLEL